MKPKRIEVDAESLTRRRLLGKNIIINLTGLIFPIVAALISIRILESSLSDTNFAVLTLVWMTLGYNGIFDLGISNAITKFVADKIGTNEVDDIANLFQSGFIATLVSSLGIALLFALFTPWMASLDTFISQEGYTLTVQCFYVVAFSIPFIALTANYRGLLGAFQRFDIINSLHIPSNMLTYLAPLGVLWFSQNVFFMVVAIAASRIIIFVLFVIVSKDYARISTLHFSFDISLFWNVISFGGWITLANVISTFIIFFERFAVVKYFSMGVGGDWGILYDLSNKLMLAPSVMASVMFPAFSTQLSNNPPKANRFYKVSNIILGSLLFYPVLLAISFSQEVLAFWINSEFATKYSLVLELMLIGMFSNAVGVLSVIYLQASAHLKQIALLLILQTSFYIPLIVLYGNSSLELFTTFSSLRMIVNTFILLLFIGVLSKSLFSFQLRFACVLFLGILVLLLLCYEPLFWLKIGIVIGLPVLLFFLIYPYIKQLKL